MPAPLRSPPPNAPPPARAPETDAERRARHLEQLREMSELAMAVARDAAAKATNPTPNPDAPDPGRTFARATHVARQAIALEARLAAGELPPIRPPRPADRGLRGVRQTSGWDDTFLTKLLAQFNSTQMR